MYFPLLVVARKVKGIENKFAQQKGLYFFYSKRYHQYMIYSSGYEAFPYVFGYEFEAQLIVFFQFSLIKNIIVISSLSSSRGLRILQP